MQQAMKADRSSTPAYGSQRESISSFKILQVEDRFRNPRFALSLLENIGHQVVAIEVHRPLSLLEFEGFDLVLKGIQMPVMDGFEAVYRPNWSSRQLPVMAPSTNLTHGGRRRHFDVGSGDFVPKLIGWPALKAAIETRLETT